LGSPSFNIAPVIGLGHLSAKEKIVFRICRDQVALALPINRRRDPGQSLQKPEVP
jgi:hypothetical protein